MMNSSVANIYRLGIKELWSLVRDPMMMVLMLMKESAFSGKSIAGMTSRF